MNDEMKIRLALEETAAEVIDLLMAKRADYGIANMATTGYFGLAVRLQDKISRLLNLVRGHQPAFESMRETLLDVVGYGLIGLNGDHWGMTLHPGFDAKEVSDAD